MKKEILIEVFKSKACDEEATPKSYGDGAFSFFKAGTNDQLGSFVDIRLEKIKLKYYITYESVSSEITKNEYDELLLIYKNKKAEYDKIIEEKEKIAHNKNIEDLMKMYKESLHTKREVLIEKYIK